MKPICLLLACLLTLGACSSKNGDATSTAVSADAPPPPPAPPAASVAPDAEAKADESPVDLKESAPAGNASAAPLRPAASLTHKQIIREGSMTVKTSDIADSKKRIDALVAGHQGYYQEETFTNETNAVAYILKIRVPAAAFEALVAELGKGEDEVMSRNIQARDVTEEYTDIEVRLANKRAYLARYRELLSRAGTVKDMLAVQENIRTIEEELESSEGRLRFLTDQVSYSTLELRLLKDRDLGTPQEEGFGRRLLRAVIEGWNSVVGFTLGLVYLWPFLLLAAVAVVLLRRWRARRRNNS